MIGWLSRTWIAGRRVHSSPAASPRDEDAELAELAALIESGDASPEALERMAKLMGQSDPNEDKL